MYAQVNRLDWTAFQQPVIAGASCAVAFRSPGMMRKEIEHLRKEMEFAVLSGHSFTSTRVVEISQELDRKLVEYMKIHQRAL